MLRKRPLTFPTDKSIRVIADTDCNCECDDQFCIAHMLMTPRFDMRGIIAEHYAEPDSEQKSYEEIKRVMSLMDVEDSGIKVLHGAKHAMVDIHTPVDSEGARFIVEEAMKDDPRPLFICGQAACTNIASAYLMEPRIARRVVVIWIGGRPYPQGGFEFNQNNDLNAVRVLFQSDLELWQVPFNVYTAMKISFFEMLNHVYPCGKIGEYLVKHTMEVSGGISENVIGSRGSDMSKGAAITSFGGELWSLGDSVCVGLMMNNTLGKFHMEKAPDELDNRGFYEWSGRKGREIRVYDTIDNRFIIQDMFEKFQFYFGKNEMK
ncbi:nucleoside hydrolase [Blautia sp. Sow4_E7]|uniref:nucleoside hydrolase n=1 Tax=Blautia sp. Sow4_E7 TaxID=3438749 RepID=UPI003F8EA286